MSITNYPYILVHGAWHGSWCWNKIVKRLEEKNQSVHAINLPGRHFGSHAGITLDEYVDTIQQRLNALDSPAILVGHSFGGIAISQLAEKCPDQIAKLVYLTAHLPENGESCVSLSDNHNTSDNPLQLLFDQEKNTIYVKNDLESLRSIFYHDCTNADVEATYQQLTPEPLLPMNTPVKLSKSKFGGVDKVYIECLKDRGISIDLQRRMHQRYPCRVYSLDSSHSPFLSQPDELATILLELNGI